MSKIFYLTTCTIVFLFAPYYCLAATLSPNSVIASVNRERQKNNLAEFAVDDRLTLAAKNKLLDMATQKYFSHASPTGDMPWDFLDAVDYPYRASGENLAQDYFNTTSLLNAWLQSETHRSNMLSTVFKDIGVAIGSVDGHTVIVAMFGATAIEPRVAGVSTDGIFKVNSDKPVEATDQLATIIPNTAPKQNEVHNSQNNPNKQPFFNSLFLFFSIFTASTILLAFWRAS